MNHGLVRLEGKYQPNNVGKWKYQSTGVSQWLYVFFVQIEISVQTKLK